jgi:hypothetical protein
VPCSGGVARLRHEAGNDAVKHHAVIETLASQLLDARDVIGRQVGAQLDLHRSGLEIENEIVGH